MSVAKIQAELANDPNAVGYAGMTDAQVFASLTAETITRRIAVSSVDLLDWAVDKTGAQDMRLLKLQTATASADADVKASAEAIIILIGTSAESIQSRPLIRLINTLVTDGALAAGDRSAYNDISSELISRAQELGLRRLGLGLIAEARN